MPRDYSRLSKEDLIELVSKQDEDLSLKYGIFWDRERELERVVMDCERALPVLERLPEREIKTDERAHNLLIEGDNYHALTALNYTHPERIDVIYIDPPYNTGNKDFIYNDRYVDKEDGYRHSKWLNFMEKRLVLTQRLLKKTGVIFISIDDNEMAQLKLLCDRIFGEENFVAQFIVIRAEGGGMAKQAVIGHEYVLTYAKDIRSFGLLRKKKDVRGKIVLIDGEEYVIEEDWLRKEFGKYGTLLYDEIETVRGSEKKQEIDIGIEQGKYVLLKKPQGTIVGRYKKLSDESSKFYTILKHLNKNGKKDLEQLELGGIFDYPKPLSLIKELVLGATFFNKDSVVLDFMAGSGTTGQAVMELNREDGGTRRFILCTNNENKICENVTYPRLEKVIRGYTNAKGETVAGLGGNMQYFRTGFVLREQGESQMRADLTQRCVGMLCVKEGIFEVFKQGEDYRIFVSADQETFVCVYLNFIEASFEHFLEALRAISGRKIVYLFSRGIEPDADLLADIPDVLVQAIPDPIVEIYDRLNRLNIPLRTDTLRADFIKAKQALFVNEEKDDGARLLRVVLEKALQKIAQMNQVEFFSEKVKSGERAALINDRLKSAGVLTKVQWEENKTGLAIGNHAAHGEYDEYDLSQVKHVYRHIAKLLGVFHLTF
jgi:adenine-specific DNA-methyltransferase